MPNKVSIPLMIRRLKVQIEDLQKNIDRTKGEDNLSIARRVYFKEAITRRQEGISFLENTYPPPFHMGYDQLTRKFKISPYIYTKD